MDGIQDGLNAQPFPIQYYQFAQVLEMTNKVDI